MRAVKAKALRRSAKELCGTGIQTAYQPETTHPKLFKGIPDPTSSDPMKQLGYNVAQIIDPIKLTPTCVRRIYKDLKQLNK